MQSTVADAPPSDFDGGPVAGLWPRLITARRTALLVALLAVGAALRVWQYLADTSFWFDELSIARNIHERSFGELMLRPLGEDQVAPLGFIAGVKSATLLLGSTELALRLLPFLFGIAALLLFWRVAMRALTGAAVPAALALFSLGIPFIRYTTELKQYGADVAATLALTLLALELRARPPTKRGCLLAGVVGLVSVWFSQAAILTLVGLGAALVLSWIRDRDEASRRVAVITVPIWALGSAPALLVFLHHVTPETRAFMHTFWSSREAFFPLPPHDLHEALRLWDRIVDLFGDVSMMRYPWPVLYVGLAVLGFVAMWRRRRDVALIVLGPIAVAVGAAAAQQYPFRTRLVLFLVPNLLLALAAAVESIRGGIARVHPVLGAAAVMLLLAPPVYALVKTPPPYTVEAFKPVLGYVQAHRRAGDAVYVHPNAYQAVDLYGPRFGLFPGSWVLGICDEKNRRSYLEDVDRFRGAPRLWVIGASVPPFRPGRRAIDTYLQAIGVRRDSFAVPSLPPLDPVSAELFDLSDAERLQSASASTFPVGPGAPPPWSSIPWCRDWNRPTAR